MPKRWLTVDPGEDTGWSMWSETTLLGGGTTKLWPFALDLWDDLSGSVPLLGDHLQLDGVDQSANDKPIDLIVCEDFRIYPWKAKDLAWDQVRTARLIGAITFQAKLLGIQFVLQGAKIKERAVAGGAEELFYRPLRENRHTNDAIMHGVYYSQTELRKP